MAETYFNISTLLSILKRTRRISALALLVSMCVGVVVALQTPKVYCSTIVLASETNTGRSGMLKDIGDIIGYKDFTAYDDAIYPEIYPDYVKSKAFTASLFDVPVHTQDGSIKTTYREYLTKHQKIPFWLLPKVWIGNMVRQYKEQQEMERALAAASPSATSGKGSRSGKGSPSPTPPAIRRLSISENGLAEAINGLIDCEVDKKSGLINITSMAQDPMVAAIVADTVNNRLQAFIKEYRSAKIRRDAHFLRDVIASTKADYMAARREYTVFSDENQEAELQEVLAKQKQLENELQIKYNIYLNFVDKFIEKQALLTYAQPVYTQIQSSIITGEPVSRSKAVTFIMTTVMAFILYLIGLVACFRKQIFTNEHLLTSQISKS